MTRIIGYCASCSRFRVHRIERPVHGTARFGRCRLGHAGPMCDEWAEIPARPATSRSDVPGVPVRVSAASDDWAELGIWR